MKEELKPCPFCGGKATVVDDSELCLGVSITCVKCNLELIGTKENCLESAITAWNRRLADRVSEDTDRKIRFILAELVSDCHIRRAEDIERDDGVWKDQSDLYTKAITAIHRAINQEGDDGN